MMSPAKLVWELSRGVLADEDGLVAVIRAFIDESGIHDGAPVITVAGYFARSKTWETFTKAWTRVLKPAGIKVFHSSDCQALQGEFKGWEKEDRDALVARLLPIIPEHAGAGIAIGLVLNDFEEAFRGREDLKELLGSPYAACFQWLIHTILLETRRANSREAIAVFHEQNDYQGDAMAAYNYLSKYQDPLKNLSGLAFGTKEKYVPLQAADVLAYEAGKRLRNQTGPERRSFSAIAPKGKEPQIRFYDKTNMARLIGSLESFKAFSQFYDAAS